MSEPNYSILKDFYLTLEPGIVSEQMLIEDKEDVDMFYTMRVVESNGLGGNVTFDVPDNAHCLITVSIPRGAGVNRTMRYKVGTYGRKYIAPGGTTGLYVIFEIKPVLSASGYRYDAFVQFQIKGGE